MDYTDISLDTFYLFETYVENVYKFGFTTGFPRDRMLKYLGVSKPQKVIGFFTCPDGKLIEKIFKQFLETKSISNDPRFGKEYFMCEQDITDLFYEFVKQVAGHDKHLKPKRKYIKSCKITAKVETETSNEVECIA